MSMPSSTDESAARPAAKHVAWSHATVYEFSVGHGGSAIPRSGGPAIGLRGIPIQTHTVAVGCSATKTPQKAQRMTADERAALLREAGYTDLYIEKFTRQTRRILRSRKANSKKAEKERELRRLEEALITAIEDDIVQQWHSNEAPAAAGKRKLEVVHIEADAPAKVQKTDRLALLYDIFASECQSSIVVI
ncbi:hypothetical protein SPRG_10488 [Saprolegnia parasitica CBS 223.65]|uniref:Uncharacterized protein n=1 Tax=Saprolegnia parasitica (strain CBS 223.65) TaxID=695850 RepID=A0A067C3N1_SAPPC|nr:hypothetical protein SPRG_10488 [Saprolegnia parasitica CBS 223.65]KDO23710.1 hypothetical protein SPRG_10488 [Saprolegnia parasitica CBS 223.65]|eukprot:XP_012205528.1 hypothetical protein SPRG_10488 [Saprolegnia parasitica CBS 223.65]